MSWLSMFALSGLIMTAFMLAAVNSDQMDVDQPQSVSGELASARSRFTLPKLFDFARYREMFKKSYKSSIEEAIRQKLFLARAFRAFVSAIKYKYKLASYYLKVNHESDSTPKEIDERRIRLGPRRSGTSQLPEVSAPLPLAEAEDIEKQLRVASERSDEEGYAEIAREIEAGVQPKADGEVRDLSLEDVAGKPDGGAESPDVAAKEVDQVPSNNPNYKEPDHHTDHAGLAGKQKDNEQNGEKELVKQYGRSNFAAVRASVSGMFYNLASQLKRNFEWLIYEYEEVEDNDDDDKGGEQIAKKGSAANVEAKETEKAKPLPDEKFVDHRESDCFFQPRNQGRCGSCYAFAYVSLIEFLVCKETGKLVQFSEQYMIDCGPDRVHGMFGCEGAYLASAARFAILMGSELRAQYPYTERQDSCPYEPKAKAKSMGYIRPSVHDALRVPLDKLDKYLPASPIVVGIGTQGDFFEYGGGVHAGVGCGVHLDHIVLLVGSGREDGEEYWLIRNSHSTAFGEDGYYKLAKKANCIFEQGYFYGNHAADLGFKPVKNLDYDTGAVKRRMMGVETTNQDRFAKRARFG